MPKVEAIKDKLNENLHADKSYKGPEEVLSLECEHEKSHHNELLND